MGQLEQQTIRMEQPDGVAGFPYGAALSLKISRAINPALLLFDDHEAARGDR
jgi:hypothetical protein